jgi:MOSC domain-containing protein YiiM
MRIISVNVGLPREVGWNGKTVTTSIFKEPVQGRVIIRKLNLDGDRQADLTVHSGVNKAVYAYPSEHYDFWRNELPGMDLPWGMFGENLTTEGVLETEVNIGDRFRLGSAELMATQPRLPCYKLGIKFGRDDIIERFLMSGRPGIYFAVVKEGDVEAGDTIEVVERNENSITVVEAAWLYTDQKYNVDLLRRAVTVKALPDGWRRDFRHRIERLSATEPTSLKP